MTGNQVPKELTPTLVKDILRAYGEIESADNDKLINEMVQAAAAIQPSSDTNTSTSSENETSSADVHLQLDLNTFARALTYDLQLYDLSNEIRVSSNYDDIFFTHNDKDRIVMDDDDDVDVAGGQDEEAVRCQKKLERETLSQPVIHRFTASAIDFAAGTYRSKGLTVLLWAAFIVTYFAYDYNYAHTIVHGDCVQFNFTYVQPWTRNQEAIGCQIYANVYKWLVIFVLARYDCFGGVSCGADCQSGISIQNIFRFHDHSLACTAWRLLDWEALEIVSPLNGFGHHWWGWLRCSY